MRQWGIRGILGVYLVSAWGQPGAPAYIARHVINRHFHPSFLGEMAIYNVASE